MNSSVTVLYATKTAQALLQLCLLCIISAETVNCAKTVKNVILQFPSSFINMIQSIKKKTEVKLIFKPRREGQSLRVPLL